MDPQRQSTAAWVTGGSQLPPAILFGKFTSVFFQQRRMGRFRRGFALNVDQGPGTIRLVY